MAFKIIILEQVAVDSLPMPGCVRVLTIARQVGNSSHKRLFKSTFDQFVVFSKIPGFWAGEESEKINNERSKIFFIG
ncbi:hypothetical protein [Marinilabilia salmonicolor]|uniref:hypothetical protein n=1 Tax=Marinilabilia salmonicolor TaxID=989 RepID=UPI00029A8B14|nr:hypothetical protein [Marinilabilia salmonicolor]